MSIPTRKLNDGSEIPLIGYGTGTALFKRDNLDQVDQATVDAVSQAIKLGFHHIDCAELYNTEHEAGLAIEQSGLPRSAFFITTKVVTTIQSSGISAIPSALDASLSKLGVDYVDLYLIHSPWFAKDNGELQQAWAEMEKCKASGKTKSIGVSNYIVEQLETIMKTAKITPAVNQVEFHPYLQRMNLLPWANEHGVVISAFGPLTTITKGKPGPVDDVLERLSKKYGVSEEAVQLRWCIDQGVAAITTSSKEERLKGYLGATKLQLTKEEQEEISKKGGEKHLRANHFMHKWDDNDRR